MNSNESVQRRTRQPRCGLECDKTAEMWAEVWEYQDSLPKRRRKGEEGKRIPKDKKSKVRRIAHEIVEVLRKIPKPLEIEVGLQFESIPAPVVKLYAKIRALRLLMIEGSENGNRKEDDKRRGNHDEGAG